MVEQARLLSQEQLEKMKLLEHSGHPGHLHSSTLKRSSPLQETYYSHAEKFAKIDLDAREKNFMEVREFCFQEETSRDCSGGHHTHVDQQVPIQEPNISTNQTVQKETLVCAQWKSDDFNVVSKVGHCEGPTVGVETNNLTWKVSTEMENSSFFEESDEGGYCATSFCLKFGQKNANALSKENEESAATSGSTKEGFDIESSSDNQAKIKIDPLQKLHTMITRKENLVPTSGCHFPLLAPKKTRESELCSSLRTIDERDLIVDVSHNNDIFLPSFSLHTDYKNTRVDHRKRNEGSYSHAIGLRE